MATQTQLAVSQRRGSFFQTWRLFATGWRAAVLLGLVFVGMLALMALEAPGRKDSVRFSINMLVSMLPFVTWILERQLADRLAFMSLVPQPVATKWLVLAPMCAIALVTAAVMGTLGRPPTIAALAVLGSAWWMIGSTRWLHPLRLWALLAWPMVALAPIAAYGAHRVGGWGAAAAVATVLGVGALLFQPRAYVGRPLPKPGTSEEAPAAAPVRRPRLATSAASGNRPSSLAMAARFLVVAMESSPSFLVVLFLMNATLGLVFSAGTSLLQPCLMMAFLGGTKLIGKAYTSETQEFLGAKPFASGPRFIGGIVFPLLFILVIPITAACFVNRKLFDHGGPLGQILGHSSPSEETIRYLHHVLGATFLPEKWPAGGLPLDLWLRLRPLLHMDLLRTALLMLTLVFAVGPFAGARSGGTTRPVPNVALALLAFACILRLAMFGGGVVQHLPVPPVWFTALLAALAAFDWARRARAVLVPSRTRPTA